MRTAYDPARVRQLSLRTVIAVDALSMISSPDPAAADAIRTVRLLRRNLEDLWMPLLRQIETSRAMIAWTGSAAAAATELVGSGRELIVDWIDEHAHVPADDELAAQLRSMTDDEFLVRLALIGDEGLPFDGRNGLDLDDQRWVAAFPIIATEMAHRVIRDPTFAARLVNVANDNPAIGLAIRYAEFPTPFVRDVAIAMLQRTSRIDDFETRSEATAANVALEALADEPSACLAVLLDQPALGELASWSFLDQDVVARVVQSGLYSAVDQDPSLLHDGYRVIGALTELANGSLGHGFGPGMAHGVATSMVGYVDTLGRSIDKEDGGQVRVTTLGEHGFTIELGAYEEVRNLFGAIARDVNAQAALGVVLGAYMNTVVADLGTDIVVRSGVDHVAQFADLIGDAVTAEQAEMIATAAAETAQNGTLVGLIGFGSGNVLARIGAGPLVGFVAAQVVSVATSQMAHVEAAHMPDRRLRHVAYDAIIVGAVTTARRATTADLADDEAALRQVDDYLERLADLDAAGDAEAYRDEVSDMVDFIEQRTPRLDAFLTEIRSIPAVNELTEGHR